MLAERIAESSPRELAVVGDNDCLLVLPVHGELIVVRGDATGVVGLRGGPALVTGGANHTPDRDVDVVVEQEPLSGGSELP